MCVWIGVRIAAFSNVNHANFGKALLRVAVRTFLSFTLLLSSSIPLSRLRLPTSARRQRNVAGSSESSDSSQVYGASNSSRRQVAPVERVTDTLLDKESHDGYDDVPLEVEVYSVATRYLASSAVE